MWVMEVKYYIVYLCLVFLVEAQDGKVNKRTNRQDYRNILEDAAKQRAKKKNPVLLYPYNITPTALPIEPVDFNNVWQNIPIPIPVNNYQSFNDYFENYINCYMVPLERRPAALARPTLRNFDQIQSYDEENNRLHNQLNSILKKLKLRNKVNQSKTKKSEEPLKISRNEEFGNISTLNEQELDKNKNINANEVPVKLKSVAEIIPGKAHYERMKAIDKENNRNRKVAPNISIEELPRLNKYNKSKPEESHLETNISEETYNNSSLNVTNNLKKADSINRNTEEPVSNEDAKKYIFYKAVPDTLIVYSDQNPAQIIRIKTFNGRRSSKRKKDEKLDEIKSEMALTEEKLNKNLELLPNNYATNPIKPHDDLNVLKNEIERTSSPPKEINEKSRNVSKVLTNFKTIEEVDNKKFQKSVENDPNRESERIDAVQN